MDVWGLVLSGIGAVLIAAGQEIVAGVTAIWLRAHEAILGTLLKRGEVDRVSGVVNPANTRIVRCSALGMVNWSAIASSTPGKI